MAVEILILSGARQGEQLVLDGRELKVGSDPSCEIFFDPQRDRAMQGRSAVLRLQEDGWYIHCAGGEALVNYQPVAGWTRVRSSDVVRMSESGPDFSFSILTGKSAAPAKRSAAPASSTAAPCSTAAACSTAVPCSTAALGCVGQAAQAQPRAAVPQAAPGDRRWLLWAIGGTAVAIVAILFGRSLLAPPTIVVNVTQPAVRPAPTTPAADPSAETPATKEVDKAKPGSVGQPEKQNNGPQAEHRPPDIATQLGEAVFLIQVEKSGHSWPYATCVAVSNDTLLTTAREAAQLAKWRAESGFKLWVTRQADGFKQEVQDIRVNGVFASLAEKGSDWIYFDSGLLTVGGKLPKTAPLASLDQLAALEAGMRVTCFGFTHEGDKATRFDKFEPQTTQGKIYVITASQDLPGRPRLLHVKADIPKNAYGSAVLNAEGQLIGLYGEAAVPPGDAAATSGGGELKNMHYVTVVNPEMLNLWLRDRNAQMWPPAAAPATPKPQNNQ